LRTSGKLATLAAVSGDQTVYLWHSASGQLLETLQSHSNHIYSVDFSPDGETVASGGADEHVYLWDVRAGGRGGGGLLVSASCDQTLRVWDVRTGQMLRILHGHTDHVRSCAVSPDGHLLASGGLDRTVRLWDMDSGRVLHTLGGHTNSIKALAFSPNSRFLASGGHDQMVRVWDLQRGDALYTLSSQTIFSVAFHPGGSLLAVGTANHAVQLWDIAPANQRVPAERKLLNTLRGHTDLVECVRFSADGHWLASCGADETVRLWDVATVTCLQSLRADGPYTGMDITGVAGISVAQKTALKSLGVVDAAIAEQQGKGVAEGQQR
jgi:WD40 repeat protein